ncbi:pro-sigmaK processing inhibitor BofA family protein [Solibacillus sp. FSL H8-0538]|uniref:pro-sigmaK processing inhibitor BofA family protein n=1 Tax=Solibacillus sp. FSL H8-0538 TaxID=2921400 RepID=UPI004046D783
MQTLIVSGICLLLFLIIIIGRNVGFGVLVERFAVLWFKVACAIVLLYVANLSLSNYGFIVPINGFSTLTIAFLGLPGVLCVFSLVIINK